MKPDALHEQPPTPYSISVEQFKVPPAQIQLYTPGEKVTRANFVNFLIRSFAVSMGQASVQTLFLRWLKLKTGLDYSTVLDNFIVAGGWDILSYDEKSEFMRNFINVNMHRNLFRIKDSDLELRIKKELETLADMNTDPDSVIMPDPKTMFAKVNTIAEFSTFAQGRVELLRAAQHKNDKK